MINFLVPSQHEENAENSSDGISLEKLCDEFMRSRAHNSKMTVISYSRLIKNHIAPHYDDFAEVKDICMSKLADVVIRPILAEGHVSTAAAVISILNMVMNHAGIAHEEANFRSIKNLAKVVNMKKKAEYEIPQKALVNKNIGKNIQYIFKVFYRRYKQKNPQVCNLLLLSFYLCLRQSEITSIKLRNINFRKHNLHIEKTKTIKSGGFDIPMCPPLEKLLAEILKEHSGNPDDYIFMNRNGNRLCASTLECYMYNTELRDQQTAHGIRAIFSTWASRNNKNNLISECVLTHKCWNRVEELYNRDLKNYLYNKRKKLMSDWINYLNGLLSSLDTAA